MIINQIVEGTLNNFLNRKEGLFESRIKICRSCKLITTDKIFGETCNGSLYLNPNTNETSRTKKDGFINGCGCVLRSKCRVEEAHCPVGKW